MLRLYGQTAAPRPDAQGTQALDLKPQADDLPF